MVNGVRKRRIIDAMTPRAIVTSPRLRAATVAEGGHRGGALDPRRSTPAL